MSHFMYLIKYMLIHLTGVQQNCFQKLTIIIDKIVLLLPKYNIIVLFKNYENICMPN